MGVKVGAGIPGRTALDQSYLHPALSQMAGKRASTGAGANDTDIKDLVCHLTSRPVVLRYRPEVRKCTGPLYNSGTGWRRLR